MLLQSLRQSIVKVWIQQKKENQTYFNGTCFGVGFMKHSFSFGSQALKISSRREPVTLAFEAEGEAFAKSHSWSPDFLEPQMKLEQKLQLCEVKFEHEAASYQCSDIVSLISVVNNFHISFRL